MQKMTLLLLNCYRIKNITEEKEKALGQAWLLIDLYTLGQCKLLMKKLSDEDVPAFKKFVRVELEPAMFQEMLVRLCPRITKEDTW